MAEHGAVTVKELREALAEFPEDAEVIIAFECEGMHYLDDVSTLVCVNGPAVQLSTIPFMKDTLLTKGAL